MKPEEVASLVEGALSPQHPLTPRALRGSLPQDAHPGVDDTLSAMIRDGRVVNVGPPSAPKYLLTYTPTRKDPRHGTRTPR